MTGSNNNDFELIRLDINSKFHKNVSIKSLNLEMVIYNDLFLEFLTADILIIDSLNLVKQLPIVGGEELIIEYKDQQNNPPVKLSFIIWEVSKQEETTQATQIYKLHLVSPNWYKATSMKLFNKFTGNTSVSIQKILSQTTPNVEHAYVYSCKRSPPYADIFSAGKTPFDVIRQITYQSHDPDHSPWIFHHSLYSYIFEPISSCLKSEPYTEIYLYPTQHQDSIDKTKISEDWFRLANQNKQYIDEKGAQRTNNITMSLANKNLTFSDFDYERDFDTIPTLEDVPLDRIDTPQYKTRCFVSNDNNVAKDANMRTAIYTLLEDNVFYVNLPGDTKLTSGETLIMDVPSKETFVNGYKKEEDLSGKFLITSSKHIIRKDNYRVVVELMKESLKRKL